MSADLDWSRLEDAVARSALRLQELAEENRTLRAELARLEAELEAARTGAPSLGAGRADEVRRGLDRLEGELAALLG